MRKRRQRREDHVQRCSVLSVVSCSKHLVPKVKFHGLARHAATKTVPEGTGARRGAEGAEKESLADLLSRCCSALSAFSARNKILATMRDADGLQCRERGEKVLPKMQTSPTLQCKGAKRILPLPLQATKRGSIVREPIPPATLASLRLCIFALNPECMDTANLNSLERRKANENRPSLKTVLACGGRFHKLRA